MLRNRLTLVATLLMVGALLALIVLLGEIFGHATYEFLIKDYVEKIKEYSREHPYIVGAAFLFLLLIIVVSIALLETIRAQIETIWERLRSGQEDNQPSLKPPPKDNTSARSPSLVPGPQPYELVGRDELRSKLKELLLRSYNRARIFVLELLPGIGKSELTIRLARDAEIKNYFDGGALWADLGPNPDVDETLRKWAAELGVDSERIKQADTDGVEEAIREAIGDRRVLLLIDDAWLDEDGGTKNIDHFVFSTAPHCTHLITTRQPAVSTRLTDEEFIIRVPELNESEGVELLKQRASKAVETADRRTLEELVQLAGGIPLALILMGKHLLEKTYPDYAPGRLREALGELRQTENRLSLELTEAQKEHRKDLQKGVPVQLWAVIETSYKALDEESRRAFGNLSIFRPGRLNGFTTEAALEVAGVSQETLRKLITHGLLEPLITEPKSSEPERYALQQTVADYARFKLPHKDAKKLHRKAVAYYQDWLANYDDREDVTSYQRWYRYEDPEWLDMKGGWLYHLAYVEDRATARLYFAQLYFDVFWWWSCYLDYPVCDRLLSDWERTQVLSEDDEEWLRLLRAFHDSYLTEYERLIKDWERTQVLSEDDEEWLRLLREFHDSHPIEYKKKGEGDWGRVEEALLGVRRLVGLEKQEPEADEGPHLQASTGTSLVHARHYWHVTLLRIRRLLGLNGQVSEPVYTLRHLRAITNIFLAHACRHRQVDDDEVDRYYDEALGLFEQAKADDWNRPWVLCELGDLYMERGRSDDAMHDKALEKCRQSLELARHNIRESDQDREVIARNHRVRADVFWQRGDLDRAFDSYAYAALYAYAFHATRRQPDHYNIAFYREMVERTLVRLRTLWQKGERSKVLQACTRLHDFWNPYWNRVSEPTVDSDIESLWADNQLEDLATWLFPSEPQKEDLEDPDDYVDLVNEVFEEMAARVKAKHPKDKAYT